MKKNTVPAMLSSLLIVVISSPAIAKSHQSNVEMCKIALSAEINGPAGADVMDFRFKSVSGARKKTYTFLASNKQGKRHVDCVVKSGKVTKLAWAETDTRLADKS